MVWIVRRPLNRNGSSTQRVHVENILYRNTILSLFQLNTVYPWYEIQWWKLILILSRIITYGMPFVKAMAISMSDKMNGNPHLFSGSSYYGVSKLMYWVCSTFSFCFKLMNLSWSDSTGIRFWELAVFISV